MKALVQTDQIVQVNTISAFDIHSEPRWEDAIVDSPLAVQFTAITYSGSKVFRNYKDKGDTWREI